MGTIPSVVVIGDHRTAPEGQALQQLTRSAQLPQMLAAAGMPDLHAGRGYPVGAAFFSQGCFYPALIGSDIGCGMALWQSDLALRKHSADKLLRRIGCLESPLDDGWQAQIDALIGPTPYRHALGTLGGGNHFAEIQRVEEVFDAALLPPEFDPRRLMIMVHSGSRGFGGAILREHLAACGHQGIAEDSPQALRYLNLHNQAVAYATANRSLIARRLAAQLGTELPLCLSHSAHNQLRRHSLGAGEHVRHGWLHRKGAAPADRGAVIIAGSRGSCSYLVMPTGKDAGNLDSLAHGAGRKWQRGAAKARLSQHWRAQDLLRNPFGGHVICTDKTLLYDEAPQAYRNIEHIIHALQQAGLIVPLLRLAPLITYKTRGGRHD